MMEQMLGMAQTAMDAYKKFHDPFNPLKQFNAMREHNIAKTLSANSLLDAGKKLKAPFFAVIASTDTAVSPETPISFSKELNMPYIVLDSACGHAAFKCDLYEYAPKVTAFLEK